jgi:hypothetical protein
MRGEALGEGFHPLGLDGQAGGRAVATEALEVLGAGTEPGVEVERGNRAAGALPGPVGAGDEDDGPREALHEPRRDDPDHALVPALVGDDIRAPAAAALVPGGDRRESLAQHSLLHRLALPVEVLELQGQLRRPPAVVRQQQLERGPGMPEPSGSVQPRRKPEADRPGVERRGVDPG